MLLRQPSAVARLHGAHIQLVIQYTQRLGHRITTVGDLVQGPGPPLAHPHAGVDMASVSRRLGKSKPVDVPNVHVGQGVGLEEKAGAVVEPRLAPVLAGPDEQDQSELGGEVVEVRHARRDAGLSDEGVTNDGVVGQPEDGSRWLWLRQLVVVLAGVCCWRLDGRGRRGGP